MKTTVVNNVSVFWAQLPTTSENSICMIKNVTGHRGMNRFKRKRNG
jgi:trehalose/maltose hydrolase-like predicted phosphorylase